MSRIGGSSAEILVVGELPQAVSKQQGLIRCALMFDTASMANAAIPSRQRGRIPEADRPLRCGWNLPIVQCLDR